MKRINKNNWLKIGLIAISILFVLPSIIFLIKNKSAMCFTGDLEFCFLLTNSISRKTQAAVYGVFLVIYIVLYYWILKKRNKLFKTEKSVYKLIFCIGFLFIFFIISNSSLQILK